MARHHAKKDQPADGEIRIDGYVSIGLVGCKRTFSFDVPSDSTDDEIEEAAKDAMFDCIEWSYTRSDGKDV